MRTVYLVAAFTAALLAGCSKPEPAAGAPSPDAVAIDSSKAPADSTATAALPDSATKDSAAAPMKDTTAAMPDTAKKH
jgi:hypothetical protein